MEESYNSIEDVSYTSSNKKGDLSVNELLDFDRLRISALTKAADISPVVKEVTIGPNSPEKKEKIQNISTVEVHNNDKREIVEGNLFEDKLREGQRQTLLIKQRQAKLQETSQELWHTFIQKIISSRDMMATQYWQKQSAESERRMLELEVRQIEMIKEMQQNDNLNILEKSKLDEQQTEKINNQMLENMNRILEEQNKAAARFAAITDSHTKICICYNDITGILQVPENKEICDKYIVTLKSIIKNIKLILDMYKTDTIGDKEVKVAEDLAISIINIKNKIHEEINSMKKQEMLKKQQEEEAKRKELEEKRAQEEAQKLAAVQAQKNATVQQTKATKPKFYSVKNYKYFEELKNFLEQYENQYKDLLENVGLKKFRFDCQKAVNTPVNAISSVSGTHMKDKFVKLSELLKGARVKVLDIQVMATQHPQGLAYCTNLLAKKIVTQGELLVSSKPEAAFPLAAVVVALWSQFPEFGKLLEAHFHRQCPYLVPMFLPQNEGQSDKEFYLSRGYRYNDEGVIEKQDKFLKRMSGIFRLRCAIWITKAPRFVNLSNPHSLSFGWQWLASFINLKPEPDISATLLHDFFTVCGSDFIKSYGKQFIKVIKLVSTDYLAILQNIDEGGPKTRLEVFLQSVLKTGQIPPPSGLLPPNTW